MAITQTGPSLGAGAPHPAPARAAVPLLRWERRTAAVGLVATAVAFGPARMAFGMLLPALTEAFSLSGAAAGLIASASFAAFATALVAASILARVAGAKLPVVLGGALALAGAGMAALATTVPWLTLGVVLATASAGLCWTPFNAVAGRLVRARRRDRVLAVVSTGTTLGVVAMALGALALAWTGASWRMVWAATAAGGALVAGLASALLPPSRRLTPRRPPEPASAIRRLVRREAWPLHALALLFGAVSAAFATFAVDHAAGAGVGPATGEDGALVTGGLVFLAYGVLGAAGFLADGIEGRAGLRGAVASCFAAAAVGTAALALASGAWPLALGGAGLVGASVMVFCALLAAASLRLFPALPVAGFTAAVLAMALGSAAGPALAGLLADAHGTAAALLAAAALSGLAAPLALALRIAPEQAASQGR